MSDEIDLERLEKLKEHLIHKNPTIRLLAVEAIKGEKLREYFPFLLRRLRDVDPNVRIAVVKTFAEWQEFRAVPALLSMLRVETNRLVRKEIADALGRIGDVRAEPGLRRHLSVESDEYVKKSILTSLGRLEAVKKQMEIDYKAGIEHITAKPTEKYPKPPPIPEEHPQKARTRKMDPSAVRRILKKS